MVEEQAPDKFTVVETVPTQKGARTLVLDRKTHTIYLPTAKFLPPKAGEAPKRRPDMEPNSFMIVVVGK